MSALSAVAGLAAIVCLGYLYFQDSGEKAPLEVDESLRVLNDVAVGREYEVEYLVRNGTGRSVQVIGTEFG
jgi:hypothetical protein